MIIYKLGVVRNVVIALAASQPVSQQQQNKNKATHTERECERASERENDATRKSKCAKELQQCKFIELNLAVCVRVCVCTNASILKRAARDAAIALVIALTHKQTLKQKRGSCCSCYTAFFVFVFLLLLHFCMCI